MLTRTGNWLAAVTAQVVPLARTFARLEHHPRVETSAWAAGARWKLRHSLHWHLTSLAAPGLLFAAHPVHVEVVCGIVGAAELLGCLCALAGLRCYAHVALSSTQFSPAAILSLSAALLLALVGAFSKETALTVLAAYIAVEWLALGMAMPDAAAPSQAHAAAPARARERSSGHTARGSVGAVLRCVAVFATGGVYMYLRSLALGSKQLVRTYRVVDNHIPFLPTKQAQLLTALHSHWYYVYTLLWPTRLCADWNYSCIPPVMTWRDARNLGTVATYAYFLATALRARPWRLRVGGSDEEVAALMHCRVHAVVLAALFVAPLFPASNIIVHIGAYFAERLLYLPSVGFCLLYASIFTRAMASNYRRSAAAVLVLTCVLLAARTIVRVPDWQNESFLFAKGAETCPDGAKARVNAGVQARIRGDLVLARTHFHAALRVLPDDQYCEPLYGLAMCAMDANETEQAVDYFTRSLACIETATMAAQALRSVLASLWEKYPDQPAVLLRYAQVATRIGGDERQACAAVGLGVNMMTARGGVPPQEIALAYQMCPGGEAAAQAAAKDGPPPQLTRVNTCKDACSAVAKDAVAVMGNASAALPADVEPMAAHLSPEDRTSLAQRMQFAVLARRFMKRHSAACRGTSEYTEVINAMQNLEPYNADLHAEWARMLRDMPSRDGEAVKHMEFAVQMWGLELSQVPAGSKDAKRAAALLDKAKKELASWEGVPAGPRSVSSMYSPTLKEEL